MRHHFLGFCVALAAGLGGAQASAATLIVDGNILKGATGVNVGGDLFDVTFADGTCVALFDGCDRRQDFTFRSQANARTAAQALLDQVLIGTFDDQPTLTEGCDDIGICNIRVPYDVDTFNGFFGPETDVLFARANNLDDGSSTSGIDGVSVGRESNGEDLTDEFLQTYAVFAPASATIPIPATAWLLLGGLAALGGLRHHRVKHP